MNGMHLLIGIGNDLLADDGIGCFVAAGLSHPEWKSFNAGTISGDFIRKIREIKPDLLVLVDAADMGLAPGSIRIIPPERISDVGMGTPRFPLDAMYEVISVLCREILIIGIQPAVVDIGEDMTDVVKGAGVKLISMFTSSAYKQIEIYHP
ncbi:MAG: hydrogenase maturation protease [Methanospirillum sp.]|uniref:hydrogenase maturation protease n=1 Tax=Methanospirillum sp. TaxID=45200 RepID=UPI00236DC2C1|nr:hydrogenase maturation protease [Methanospirillum sp.]MDD1729059.1 hydrogenase maturation protease [Methanospirillum sp.]